MTPPNPHPDHPAMSEQVRGGVAEVLAIAPDNLACGVNDITPGKAYPVQGDADGRIFMIRDDAGYMIHCLWEGCAHLNGENWTRSAAAAARAQVVS